MTIQRDAVHGITKKKNDPQAGAPKWPQNGLENSIVPSPKGLGYGLKTIRFVD